MIIQSWELGHLAVISPAVSISTVNTLSRSDHMFGQNSNLCRDDLLLLLITVLRTSLRNLFIQYWGQEMKKGGRRVFSTGINT